MPAEIVSLNQFRKA